MGSTGNPEPAHHEHVAARGLESKVIAGTTHGHALTLVELFMDPFRPTSTGRIAQDRDPPSPGVGRFSTQRVLPSQPVASDHVDMGARLPARETGARHGRKCQFDDAVGRLPTSSDTHLHRPESVLVALRPGT